MTGRKETTLAVILTVTALAAVPVLTTPAEPALTALHMLALATVLGACWTAINEDSGAVAGIAVIGLAWLLPTFAGWSPLGPYPRALLLAAPPLAVAGVAVLLGGRQPAPILLASAAVAAHALTYDPFYDTSCERTCLAAPAPLSTVVDNRTATALVTGLTLAAALVAIRRSRPPLVWTAGAATAALTVATIATGADPLPAAGAALTSAAVSAEAIRVQLVRRRVRRAVAQLAGAAPAIAAHFSVPGDGRWVDSAGRPLPQDGGPAAILLDRDTPAVRLLLTPHADPARTLAALTPADRLALQNARLRAAGAFQLDEIQASQRRIVQTADAERRRIERDLHDGAQQRLVAVAMHLGSARPQADTATAAAIAAATHHVRQALAALRAQSSESSEVLATEGLTAAIEDLTDRAAVDVDLHVALTGTSITWPAQRAAVAVVAEGLDNVARHAGTGQASVNVADDGTELTIRITDNGPGGAFPGPGLTALADRAGALGGHFQLVSPAGAGTTIVVTLPCA
ncbi:sensor histidine kinase [Phytohabitans sp. LJ34]|uniref:sensor histidine kinase n=1 Tax=Phytohabitans sp. LJ34 TaxID=3452217 RepID=UPI003F8BF24E